jgi:hypothetical protein
MLGNRQAGDAAPWARHDSTAAAAEIRSTETEEQFSMARLPAARGWRRARPVAESDETEAEIRRNNRDGH